MLIHFLRYITPKRIINAIKIILSFYISRILRKPIVYGYPISFSVEPTNHCNLKCPECPSGTGTLTRPLGLLKFNKYKNLIDQISPYTSYIQLFFQGEPYLNKDLPEMINYARSKKIFVSISTNGLLFDEKRIDKVLASPPDKLIFSIDGLDEESYQNYRVGGTFSDADTALRLLIKRKKELGKQIPFIELQFIVMKQNEHQIESVHKYAKETGVDYVALKTMQVSSLENALLFLPKNQKYSRYIIDGENLKLKNQFHNHCFALWRTAVVTWDGKVVPCCFDKDAKYMLGNLTDMPFIKIWNSVEYNDFRKKILDNRKSIDICRNCTEGLDVNIKEIFS